MASMKTVQPRISYDDLQQINPEWIDPRLRAGTKA